MWKKITCILVLSSLSVTDLYQSVCQVKESLQSLRTITSEPCYVTKYFARGVLNILSSCVRVQVVSNLELQKSGDEWFMYMNGKKVAKIKDSMYIFYSDDPLIQSMFYNFFIAQNSKPQLVIFYGEYKWFFKGKIIPLQSIISI